MPPKAPANAAPGPEPEPEPEAPPPWPGPEAEAARAANAQAWLVEAVQAKQNAKATAIREAYEAEVEARENKLAAERLQLQLAAEEEAHRLREQGVLNEAQAQVEAKRAERMGQLGAVCWPTRPKSVYLSYAKDAAWHERGFVSGLVVALAQRGLSRLWVDKDEGVLGSQHCIVDRADALQAARSVVMVVSATYLVCKEAQLEMRLIRSRCMGGHGGALNAVIILYGMEELSDFRCGLVDDLQTIMYAGESMVLAVAHPTEDVYMDAEGVADMVLEQVEPLLSPRAAATVRERSFTGAPDRLAADADMAMHALSGAYLNKRVVQWNEQEVVAWLQSHGKTLAKFAPEFRCRRIDGFRLVVVTDEALEVELGMTHAATRAKLLRLLDERLRVDAGRLTGPALDQLSGTELSDFILDMFHAADTDRNGVLDRKEFKACLGATYLNLSTQQILRIMVEADENEDGILDYKEFTPLMTNLIRMAGAREKAHQTQLHRAAAAQAEAGRLVKGLRKQELEALMQALFRESDVDGNGVLDRKELKACLLRPELGLSRKELNHLLSELKVDDANAVQYKTFVPLCFDILHQRLSEDLQGMSQDGNAIYQLMLKRFSDLDHDGVGKLPLPVLRGAMETLSRDTLGLSNMQQLMLMAEVQPDKHNRCDYRRFIEAVLPVIQGLLDITMAPEREKAIAAVAEADGAAYAKNVRGLNAAQVTDMLRTAMRREDRAGVGSVDRKTFGIVLQCLAASELKLSSFEAAALMAATDTQQVAYGVYELNQMFHVLAHLDLNQKVLSRLESSLFSPQ